MLEWGIDVAKREGYNLNLQKLSSEEEKVVEDVSNKFKEASKMREIYSVNRKVLARLCNPIFWYLTLPDMKFVDGSVKTTRKALIPSVMDSNPKKALSGDSTAGWKSK
ncbi:MAG: hypothetical protein QXU67_01135 [Candidatus Bathyarchaeia archaeon]